MKILKIYENIIREENTSATADFCVKQFGRELFADQLGGDEPNTKIEDYYASLIRSFTFGDYGFDLRDKLINALNELRICMDEYPEILVSQGIVYRGIVKPFKLIFDNCENFDNHNEMLYEYNATSIVQSWTENHDIALQFSYGGSKSNTPVAFHEFWAIKDNYYRMSENMQISYLERLMNKFPFLNDDVRVMLITEANENEFLFKAKYFKRLSDSPREDEVLRIDNRPLRCTLNTAPAIVELAKQLRKYQKQLDIIPDDFE